MCLLAFYLNTKAIIACAMSQKKGLSICGKGQDSETGSHENDRVVPV